MATTSKEKACSGTDLLDEHSSPLNMASLSNALLIAGLVEKKEYVSSSGSGEIKSYLSLTQSGQQYGVNRSSPFSEKTDLRFYRSTFKAVLVVASNAILKHAESL